MPFEDTHILLANQIKQKLQTDDFIAAIEKYPNHYYLGSVFPDILFYSKDASIVEMAYKLHGNDGSLTNQLVFQVLDEIKITRDWLNFAFIAGYLTHCAADMTFHPMVNYLSGYNPNGNHREKQKSSYLHWCYETLIDSQLNSRFRFNEIIHPALIDKLIVPQLLALNSEIIVKALERQILYLGMIRSRFYYYVFRVLRLVGAVPPETVAGFFANLKTEDISLPEIITYKDIISGKKKETSLEQLSALTIDLGCQFIDAAYQYYKESITREEAKNTIAGENLATGRLGQTKDDIRFFSKQ